MVTNLRPGTLGRLRLTYEDVVAVRPDIVYCQAQGYPSDSPAADAPAYDDVIQAGSGIPDTFRRQGGEPVLVPTLVADKVSGLTIAYAVLAALLHRERTGEGQRVEVPMIDVMTAFTLVEHAGAATAVPPQGPPGYPRILNPERQPQRTSDGWINVLAYTRENYEDLFDEGGRPDLAEDERIRSRPVPDRQRRQPLPRGGRGPDQRTTAEWLAFCADGGDPGVGGADPRGAGRRPARGRPPRGRPLQGDPPARAVLGPSDGPTVRRPAALSGQHNDEVLAEVAAWPDGRTTSAAQRWRRSKADHGEDHDDHTDATIRRRHRRLDDGHVAEVEMHRPPANYFDAALLAGVVDAVDWAERPAGRAVVLCARRAGTSAPDSTSAPRTSRNRRRWSPSTARPAS